MKSTVVIVDVGTFFVSRCALIQTTLPAGAVKPFHETGAPDIAVPLGGITQAPDSGGLIISGQTLEAVSAGGPAESVTVHTSGNIPNVVGVPVMAPVPEFNIRPSSESGGMHEKE